MQKVTVTFTTDDETDPAKLTEVLARRANGFSVVVEPAKFGAANDITFVEAVTVEETAQV
jgi:hypothetical protein